MESKLHVFLFDNSNNILKDLYIDKPNSYQNLLIQIKNTLIISLENYNIYYQSSNDKMTEIHNEEEYKLLKDIIYILPINSNNLDKILLPNNLNLFKPLEGKVNCFICSKQIKNENPLYCYNCRNIFHSKCLKKSEKNNFSKNKASNCPNCKKEVILKELKKKADYEEEVGSQINILEKIKEYKINNNINSTNKKIKEKNFDELFEKYYRFMELSINTLKNILIKLNSINALINMKNDKIFQIIYNLTSNKMNPPINDISRIIYNELEKLEKYISIKSYSTNEKRKSNSCQKKPVRKINNIKINPINTVNKVVNNYRKEINLIYFSKKDEKQKIFGKEFVENNIDDIELVINGNKNPLTDEYTLKQGKNNIKLILKNTITKLQEMFYGCETLINIEELKYLNTKEVTDFSYAFDGCISLIDIKSLEFWDVSKGGNFQGMFAGCSNISDFEPLKKWKIINGTNFSGIFFGCKSMTILTPLLNWNTLKEMNLSLIFSEFSLKNGAQLKLKDIEDELKDALIDYRSISSQQLKVMARNKARILLKKKKLYQDFVNKLENDKESDD